MDNNKDIKSVSATLSRPLGRRAFFKALLVGPLLAGAGLIEGAFKDASSALTSTATPQHAPELPADGHDPEALAALLFKEKPTSDQIADLGTLSAEVFADKYKDQLRTMDFKIKVREVGFDGRDAIRLIDRSKPGEEPDIKTTIYTGQAHVYGEISGDGLTPTVFQAGNTATKNGSWQASVSGGIVSMLAGHKLAMHMDDLPVPGQGSIPTSDYYGKHQKEWTILQTNRVEGLIRYAQVLDASQSFNNDKLDYKLLTKNGNTALDSVVRSAGMQLPAEVLSGTVDGKGGSIKVPGVAPNERIADNQLPSVTTDYNKMTMVQLAGKLRDLETGVHDSLITKPTPSPVYPSGQTAMGRRGLFSRLGL